MVKPAKHSQADPSWVIWTLRPRTVHPLVLVGLRDVLRGSKERSDSLERFAAAAYRMFSYD